MQLIKSSKDRTTTGRLEPPAWRRRVKILLNVVACLFLGALSIWLAVRVTPMQTVKAAGQTVQVGATSPRLSGSGPGEVNLFGQAISTRPEFRGPIRPRLELTHITINAQVGQFARDGDHGTLDLSARLTDGWRRYLLWETLVSAGFSALLLAALAGVQHWSGATRVKVLATGVLCVLAANSACVYLLASSTPEALKRVGSVEDLVGRAPSSPVPPARGPALNDVNAVVIGDSTAAAMGNPLVDDPDALDRACKRSRDSYAVYLAQSNRWKVLNLACSGATVTSGLLDVQNVGHQVAPPQLAVAQRASKASVVIVSIGANDVRWAELTGLCLAAKACDDRASTAYYQQQLNTFATEYYDLLGQLKRLPQHPAVLINQYYDPFGENVDCLRSQGVDQAMADALRGRLADMNALLDKGARAFGFRSVPQHFSGHGLCSQGPFVQGTGAEAPLHPTAAGELAIALADQQALNAPAPQPTPSPSNP
ncbi:GDSL-type esterase/lipase family protein [Actinomadura nitritigenes]|uniref:GDSL-type esterase/lipase family protein n=1 Tax=Actinomadura nitritigenes TaxID=134602 RepID=UPI00367EA740